MDTHVCSVRDYCTCYPLALEPDEHCYIHGWGEYPRRCGLCGRFITMTDVRETFKRFGWVPPSEQKKVEPKEQRSK